MNISKTTDPISTPPLWFVVMDFGYLTMLVAAGLAYLHWGWLRHIFPEMLGPIPVGVPWWGALGGISISFSGIVQHRTDWDPTMKYWHMSKPFLAAVAATVSYLIFTLLIRSTGTSVPSTNGTFYVVSFLVGYRESAFRQLIKEATDLLLKPGKGSSSN